MALLKLRTFQQHDSFLPCILLTELIQKNIMWKEKLISHQNYIVYKGIHLYVNNMQNKLLFEFK